MHHDDPVRVVRPSSGWPAWSPRPTPGPTIAPTDRSMPPPVMTNVMPIADHADDRGEPQDGQHVVDAGEPVAGGDDADDAQQHQGDDQAEVAPDRAGRASAGEAAAGAASGGAAGRPVLAGVVGRRGSLSRVRLRVARARSCRASFHDQVEDLVLVELVGRGRRAGRAPRRRPGPGRPDRAPPRSRWTRRRRRRPRRRGDGRGRRSRVRAPTSTPRVGSSSSSTRQSAEQPAGQHDLLLVAAGQGARPRGRRRRGARRAPRPAPRRGVALGAAVEEAAAREAGEAGDADVVADRLRRAAAPWLLRSSGASPTPAATAAPHRPGAQPPAVDGDRAGGRPCGRRRRLEDLGAPGADQPGEPDDLAGADVEGDVRELARAGRGPRPRSSGSASATALGRGREDVLDRAAGHQPDELRGRASPWPAGRWRRCGRP